MSKQTIGQLQIMLLESVILGRPLPSSTRNFTLPDISFVINSPQILIAQENLLEPDLLTEVSLPLRLKVLPIDTIQERARYEERLAYLRFQAIEIEDDAVTVTLQAELALRDPTQGSLGLSGVRAKFKRGTEGIWQLIGKPTIFAS